MRLPPYADTLLQPSSGTVSSKRNTMRDCSTSQTFSCIWCYPLPDRRSSLMLRTTIFHLICSTCLRTKNGSRTWKFVNFLWSLCFSCVRQKHVV